MPKYNRLLEHSDVYTSGRRPVSPVISPVSTQVLNESFRAFFKGLVKATETFFPGGSSLEALPLHRSLIP